MAHHEQDDMTVRVTPAARWPADRVAGARAGGRGDGRLGMAHARARPARGRPGRQQVALGGRAAQAGAGDHDDVVIVGSSRILFDTDLDVWEEMTGRRPLQLALVGHESTARPAAAWPRKPTSTAWSSSASRPTCTSRIRFSYLPEFADVLDFWQKESPVGAGRSPDRAHCSPSNLAFLDEAYRLAPLIERLDIPNRQGVRRPYLEVWKLAETSADRQHRMWPRLETGSCACAITRGWCGARSTGSGP